MALYDSSKTNKTGRQNRLYKDIDMDFVRNSVTNDVNTVENVNAVKRSLRNLIQTNFYERPFQPELGCGIRELLFENFTPITGMFIRRKLEEVITNYEPRARLADLSVSEKQDKNAIEVTISFYVLNMPQPVSVTTLLQRVR